MNREAENPRLFTTVCWFLNFVSSSRRVWELVWTWPVFTSREPSCCIVRICRWHIVYH